MDFNKEWTANAIEFEVDRHGCGRLVKAHNNQVAELKKELTDIKDELDCIHNLWWYQQ